MTCILGLNKKVADYKETLDSVIESIQYKQWKLKVYKEGQKGKPWEDNIVQHLHADIHNLEIDIKYDVEQIKELKLAIDCFIAEIEIRTGQYL